MLRCVTVAVLLLVHVCHSQLSRIDRLKISMTFDEVQKIMGKPIIVERGIKQLENTALENGILTPIDTISESENLWILPKTIITVGQDLYVSWVYSYSKLETTVVYLNVDIPLTVPVNKYFLNHLEITEGEYQATGDMIYRKKTRIPGTDVFYHRIVSKEEFSPSQTDRSPEMVEHREVKQIGSEIKQVKKTIRKLFKVTKLFNVIFEAASGRAMTFDYVPRFILSLN